MDQMERQLCSRGREGHRFTRKIDPLDFVAILTRIVSTNETNENEAESIW